MKIGIISDLHITHWRLSDEYVAELLIKQCQELGINKLLDAGDSEWHDPNEASDIFLEADIKYISVNGNHDYYSKSVLDIDYTGTYEHLSNEWIEQVKTETYLIQNTLWSDIQGIEQYSRALADFHYIDGLTPPVYQDLHNRSLNSIVADLDYLRWDNDKETGNRVFAILTHHAPSKLSVTDPYKGNVLNKFFVNDLDNFIIANPDIKLWIHGHTHTPVDYMVGNCRVVANQCGYPRENHKLMRDYRIKTIEL